MGNGKTLVLALFSASELENPAFEKTDLICSPECKQKNSILALTPTLNSTQIVTLALTLTLILTQNQNLNSN